jgi:STE24 endopeptidase
MHENALPNRRKIKRYSSVKACLALSALVLPAAAAALFHFFISHELYGFLMSSFGSMKAVFALYVLSFLLFIGTVLLPLRFASSFLVEKKYGLTRRSVLSWALDETKSSALNLVFSLCAILFFYASIAFFPRAWWLVSAFSLVAFSVLMAFLAPVLIIPLFFKYIPIGSDDIEKRIKALAERAGVRVRDICAVDLGRKTLKANAAVVGMGKTRKVLLSDTLIENFNPDEIETVAAHEFGHHKMLHIPKMTVFSSLLIFAGFFLLFSFSPVISGIAGTNGLLDVRSLPVIFFFAGFFEIFVLPARNFLSRHLEREADRFALDLTSRPEVFIDTMKKLASMNFAEENPTFLRKVLLFSHPPIAERIASARERCAPGDVVWQGMLQGGHGEEGR